MLIHFIWINNDVRTKNNFDRQTQRNLKTFSIYRKLGWKIIVWDNAEVYSVFCVDTDNNKELCEILTNVELNKQHKITLAMKSDILRLFIISEFGGMYFDTDFIALRNMDHIISNKIKDHGLIVAHSLNDSRSLYLSQRFFCCLSWEHLYQECQKSCSEGCKRTRTIKCSHWTLLLQKVSCFNIFWQFLHWLCLNIQF